VIDWHRLFGLILTDFFSGSSYVVELEKDLSLKKQLLDVVIVRKGLAPFPRRLPDGLDDMSTHNLLSFKSYQEALDDWALKELTGHYVNYRKQVSPSVQRLLPEEEFRLLAVSARFPQNLANQVPFTTVQQGVYDCWRGTDRIRVLVLRELPMTEHNAPLHLFTASAELVQYGAEHYQPISVESSRLLLSLVGGYRREGLDMPYTMADFRRDFAKEMLEEMTPQERLKGLTAEQLLESLPAEEIERFLALLKAREKSAKEGPSAQP
jgi:hypothetical protein